MMPHQEHVHYPYFPAVVLFPFYVIFQQFQQKFFYENIKTDSSEIHVSENVFAPESNAKTVYLCVLTSEC